MKNFIEKIKSYLPQKTISYEKRNLSPERDWFYMICFLFFGIVVVTIVSWNFYYKIKNRTMWKPESEVQTKTYKLNSAQLSNTLDYFGNKNIKFENFKNNGQTFNDPFL